MKLKLFHEAKAPLANGHRRDNLPLLSDDEFESNHGFIQWAFPTPEASKQVTNAPALDLQSAVWLAENDEFIVFLEKMAVRFLEFLSAKKQWRQAYDHNHLRISRAIQSLRILHSWELAVWFHQQVINLAGPDFALMTTAAEHWSHHASSIHDKCAGSLVGLAIGDALGAPVEFCGRGTFEPVTGYRSGGKFSLPAGAWTDDTAMALCLANSLISHNGLDQRDLLDQFCDWAELGENTSTGVAVGIGQNTLRTLGNFKRNDELLAKPFGRKNDGNGSIMRLAPVACFFADDISLAVEAAGAQSLTTHSSTIAKECCEFLATLLLDIINDVPWDDGLRSVMKRDWCDPIASAFNTHPSDFVPEAVRSTGYVVDTLHAAVWAVSQSNSFEDAVLTAVNLGDDADTVGAVTGQLAGGLSGYSEVPRHLKGELLKERQIYVTSQFLSGARPLSPTVR